MVSKFNLSSGLKSAWRLPKRYIFSGLAVVGLAGLVAGYVWLFAIDKQVVFSFGGENCLSQIVPFPQFYQSLGSDQLTLSLEQPLTIAHWPVAARQMCLEPTQLLDQGQIAVSAALLGWSWGDVTLQVEVPAPPSIESDMDSKPVAASKPLALALNEPDSYHLYSAEINDQKIDCDNKKVEVVCSLEQAKVKQGKTYDVAVNRHLIEDSEEDLVAEFDIEILKAVKVVKSEIKSGETIYDKRTSVELKFDKPIQQVEATIEVKPEKDDKKRRDVEVETKVDESKLVISWQKQLPREADIVIGVDKVEAKDGSTLADPYRLPFKTSGGPGVAGINLPTFGVAGNSVATIAFDQPLAPGQDVAKLLSIDGGEARFSQQGNSFVVELLNIPACTAFTLHLAKGVASNHEIDSSRPWSFGSKTSCQRQEVIGHSVDGRPIWAYFYGRGSESVLFTGAIHGSELSSSYLMENWMDELEANFERIPGNLQVVVVPEVNPDGVLRGERMNSRGVDLNRNFDVSDWKSDIEGFDGEKIKKGGGAEPMSEPETQALANLTKRLRPRLTMSFHSIGGVVLANQAGNSAARAAVYAEMTPYYNGTGQSSEVFDYQITGTYDDWVAEKLGLPSVLVELGSHTYSEFPANKAALWRMVEW